MKWSVQQYLEAGGQQGLFTERSLESVVHWPSWPHGEPVQALLQPVTSIGLATAEVTMLSSGCCIRNNYMSLQQTFQGSWEKAWLLGEVQIHSCTSPRQKVLMLLMLIGTRQE